MEIEKHLYILRGVPGSGKSKLAALIAPDHNVAADDYFDLYNGGKFNPNFLPDAHAWCLAVAKTWMGVGEEHVAVHNTFTREWEFEKYVEAAKEYGYTVHTIIVENRHGSSSVHDVPANAVERMKERFEVKL